MRGRFAKGMVLGSMLGASLGMVMSNGGLNRKKIMRSGRQIARGFNDIMKFIR